MICKYVDRKGSTFILTFVQSLGVAPEVNLRISTVEKGCKQVIHPGLETLDKCHQKFKRGISYPTKRTCVLEKKKKEKKGVTVDVFYGFVF